MSIVQSGAQHRLRYNHAGGADGARQLLGVVKESRIPGGSPVYISVDHPTVLPQTDDAQRNGTSYPSAAFVIESAPRPVVVPTAGGAPIRSDIRTLSVGGALPNGVVSVAQVEPSWAAVGTLTPAVSPLVPKGRYGGFIPEMPTDPNGTVPNSGHRPAGEMLRVRLVGTAEAAETVDAGGNTGFTFQLVNTTGPVPAADIAPGSVIIDATFGGNVMTVRDNGAGRLVGQESVSLARADGTIDYRTGIIVIRFSVASDAVAVVADYEHSTLYLPLDIDLSWDAEMAMG